MPLGEYEDWAACIAAQKRKGKSQEAAERICGALEGDAEKNASSTAKFRELKGIEIFDVGKWNGRDWTDEDLDEVVENFEELGAVVDVPAIIGHSEQQDLLSREELPAAGWVKKLYRKGTKLVADIARVPEKLAKLMDAGAYRNISAEIFTSVWLDGKKWQNVLRAVAFLGGEIPAVSTLDDIVELYFRPRGTIATLGAPQRTWVTYRAQKEDFMSKERRGNREKANLSARRTARDMLARLGQLFGLSEHDVDDSYEKRTQLLDAAVREKFRGGLDGSYAWVAETFDDRVIVCKDGAYYELPYSLGDDDEVTLGEPVEVEQTWRPKQRTTQNTAGAPGEKEAGMATQKAVLSALGLPETADDAAAVKAIETLKAGEKQAKEDLSKLSARVDALDTESKQRKAETAVDAAIREKKILPASREAMVRFALADAEGFVAFVKDAKPILDTSEHGTSADAPESKSEVAQFRSKVAEKVKAGKSLEEAQRDVAAEEPELYAAVVARR